MLITRVSLYTGKTRTKDLPITQEQINLWQQGTFIQDAFPHLSKEDREFINTGITAEEWDEMFLTDDESM